MLKDVVQAEIRVAVRLGDDALVVGAGQLVQTESVDGLDGDALGVRRAGQLVDAVGAAGDQQAPDRAASGAQRFDHGVATVQVVHNGSRRREKAHRFVRASCCH